jgi:serine phosphatase RsbU (regulator of sigma subunit)
MDRSPAVTDPTPLSPLESLVSGVRHRQVTERGAEAWWLLKRSFLLGIAGAALVHLPGIWGNALGGVAGFVALLLGLRCVGMAVSFPRWWRISFAVLTAILLLSFSFGLGHALYLGWLSLFLLFRRYRIYREIHSRQRALVFLMAGATVVLWLAAPSPAESSTWVGGLFANLRGVAKFGLIMMWVMSLLWLVGRARLHFLRLRMKLAVVSLLVAQIPILLLLVFAAVSLFGFLGGSRASQGSALLEQWMAMVGRGELAGEGPFTDAFGEGLDKAPVWADSLGVRVVDAHWDPQPESILLRRGDDLWLIRLAEPGQSPAVRAGYRFDRGTAQRMANILRCGVNLTFESDIRLSGENNHAHGELWARPATADSSGHGLLDRWIPFGAVPVPVHDYSRIVASEDVYLLLETRPEDLLAELTPSGNDVQQAVGIALVIVAVIFAFLQLLALLFGMRIVGGVTSAVKKLHRATEALAGGKLDTRIDLPNEDEFGDLAASFNEMTRAIQLGQEQALQRQVLEREVMMARRIQERLLPESMPTIEGYELSASSDPSRQVGGDYFDFIELSDGRWGFAVGDVTGKGVPAALLMSNVQASLHGQAMHPGSVASTVERMNGLLADSTDPNMFVTFFYGVLDPATGEILCTNAGHEPPIIRRADGSIERVRSGGLILGMLAGQTYAEQRVQLDPGDLFVLYTDGVTEATGPGHVAPEVSPDEDDDAFEDDINFFEEDRLLEVVRDCGGMTADAVRQRILREVSAFTEGTPQSDDITVLVLRRREDS